MTKKSEDIVFTAALRTGIGKYKGIWSKYQAHDLGESVLKNILKNQKLSQAYYEVIMGQVLTEVRGKIQHDKQQLEREYLKKKLDM
ncbi:MAG: hypothetical protein CM1200mP5_3830 [Candidatus Pelagibacterales bacterium]|nr:MAG: hypothetical protein CM1200mP5_3830 [Pelagibacterales bacterium]